MPKTITLKEILSLNPQIDEKLLKKVRDLRRKLQQMGVNSRGYNLAFPFGRRHKAISKRGSHDPRSIQVGQSKRI